MPFVILIGASGAGKTAIARTIASHYSHDAQVFHFDHIGVPSAQQMIADYGAGEAWQRTKTLEWSVKLASVVTATSDVLFEGQTRPSFLAEAAAAMGNIKYTLILIDCDDRTRARRLSHDRQQPELITDDLINWARYLRREAQAHGYEILDTSILPLHESVAYVLARLRPNDEISAPSRGEPPSPWETWASVTGRELSSRPLHSRHIRSAGSCFCTGLARWPPPDGV